MRSVSQIYVRGRGAAVAFMPQGPEGSWSGPAWNSMQRNISDGSLATAVIHCLHSYWRQFLHQWLKPKQCTRNTASHETQ